MEELALHLEGKLLNDAHYALAQYGIPVITTNVDTLHELAGTGFVVKLHGRIPNKDELATCDRRYIMEYINYGNGKFDLSKFEDIRNEADWPKPLGGLWASPITDSVYSWKEFCEDNDFKLDSFEDPENSFKFRLSDDSNILVIDSILQLPDLPKQKTIIRSWTILDFEKLMSMGFDAVQVNISSDYNSLYNALYTWDCDSILVMNKSKIEME